MGGTIAKYASEGVDVFLLTATRGDSGRYRGHRPDEPQHPGPSALASIRETSCALPPPRWVCAKSHCSTTATSISTARTRARRSPLLWDTSGGSARCRRHVRTRRRLRAPRPHRDLPVHHGASWPRQILRFATEIDAVRPHAVSKLYYMAWPESTWRAYQAAFRKLVSTVDGVERQAVPWPDWAITTVIDTRSFWSTAWKAISCHESQVVAMRVEGPVVGPPRGVVGLAILLSGVQHRERWTSTRDRSLRGDHTTATLTL